jgi:hypothetical protein
MGSLHDVIFGSFGKSGIHGKSGTNGPPHSPAPAPKTITASTAVARQHFEPAGNSPLEGHARGPAGSSPAGPAVTPPATLAPLPKQPPLRDVVAAATPAAKPLTLETIVAEVVTADRNDTETVLRIGKMLSRWSSRQPDPAAAIAEARAALVAVGLAGDKIRTDRYVGLYRVAALFGADVARKMAPSALRHFLPMIHLTPDGHWRVRAKIEKQAREIFTKAGTERLTAADIGQRVSKLRPRRRAGTPRQLGVQMRVRRLLARASVEDLTAVAEWCKSEREKRFLSGIVNSEGTPSAIAG